MRAGQNVDMALDVSVTLTMLTLFLTWHIRESENRLTYKITPMKTFSKFEPFCWCKVQTKFVSLK